jgi:hypothetical protein
VSDEQRAEFEEWLREEIISARDDRTYITNALEDVLEKFTLISDGPIRTEKL